MKLLLTQLKASSPYVEGLKRCHADVITLALICTVPHRLIIAMDQIFESFDSLVPLWLLCGSLWFALLMKLPAID